jgi:hypothetical protein
MTEKPSPPAAFLRVCRQFHVDIGVLCPTFELMAAFALQRVEEAERITLAEYLDRLLSGEYTDDELEELWNSSGADVFIPDVRNLKALLTEMRRQLQA